MTKHFSTPLALGAAIAFILPSTAFAEVTAAEVWESWKSYGEKFGQTVTVGSEETTSDALILRNVTMSVDMPEGSATGTLELLEFRERGDGTVAVTMSPDFPFSMTFDPDGGEAADMAMIIRQSGISIIASGDADNISFDYLAAEVSIGIDKMIIDGVDLDADIEVALFEVEGKYALTYGENDTYVSQLVAADAALNFAFTDPEEGGRIVMQGTIEDLRTNSTASIPSDFELEDPAAMFTSGFDVQGGFSSGASSFSMSMEGASEEFSLSSTAETNSLDFAIGNGSISYGGSATGLNYVLQSPELPFPELTMAMAETGFKLLMPLQQSEEPSDFTFAMSFIGLEVSNVIWNMLDPAEMMPRDPATIIIDISGQMNWLFDIMGPAQAENFDDETPAEIHNLSINDITVSAVGAEITGTGEFTFDNSDLDTFEGIPAPTGAIDMQIVGINGLLDTLIQMGLLPNDQAMGARMMLGLFARPGDGEDTLVSTIEVNGDGSVFANGQQLK